MKTEIVELPNHNPRAVFTTRVGRVRVSTIDRLHPDSMLSLMIDTLILDTALERPKGRYETMAFRCDEEGHVHNFQELALERCDDLALVREMHDRMVSRFNVEEEKT